MKFNISYMEAGERKSKVLGIKGKEPITGGFEKRVFAHESGDRIVKIEREDPNREPDSERKVKAQYYLTKILHLIFPNNIPYIHLAAKQGTPVTVRRKVDLNDEHAKVDQVFFRMAESGETNLAEAFEAGGMANTVEQSPLVQYFINQLHDLGLRFDSTGGNFAFDNLGNPVYVDDFQVWYKNKRNEVVPYFDEIKLSQAIDNLPDEQKELATNYFYRLKNLLEDEQQSLAA